MSRMPLSVACLCLFSFPPSAEPREELGTWRVPDRDSEVSPLHGEAIAPAGDVDGDGVGDFLIATVGFGSFEGMVQVTSGATGDVLHEFHEAVDSEIETTRFGIQVGGLGDLNGDGHDDFFVSEPDFARGNRRFGRVTVFSGRDGTVIRTHSAKDTRTEFGLAAAAAGDVDLDGVQDLLVGEPGWTKSRGRVHVFSGRTGDTLSVHHGFWDGERMGTAVSGVGDVDHDGADDYVYSTGFLAMNGRVIARSGGTGDKLHERTGGEFARLGERLAAAGDLSGDGTPDYLTFRCGGNHNFVDVVSGSDGSVVESLRGLRDDGFAHSFTVADVNGDGRNDVVVGSPHWSGSQRCMGRVEVFCGDRIRRGVANKAIVEFPGPKAFARRGAQVTAAGDLDGDGQFDLLMTDRGQRSRDAMVSVVPGRLGTAVSQRRLGLASVSFPTIEGDAPCGDVLGPLHVPDEYPTIQDAIRCAARGATIVLAPGVYTGPGNRRIRYLLRGVRVTSAKGPLDCLINGEFDGPLFEFFGDGNGILEGVTVLRGFNEKGGAVEIFGEGPTIRRCVFMTNVSRTDGGAIHARHSDFRMDRCFFERNLAITGGGAIALEQSRMRLLNSLLLENRALLGNGGAVVSDADQGSGIKFCTFSKNGATLLFGVGSAVHSRQQPIHIRNSIFWKNSSWLDDEILMPLEDNSVRYCLVDGGWSGRGVVDQDPLFVDPDNLDYHLRPDSPCVDTGGNRGPGNNGVDLDGDRRVLGGAPDMGMDEWVPRPRGSLRPK